MAKPHLITACRALANAVEARDWPEAERLSSTLALELERSVNDKPPPDRDGIFSIGWQHYQSAPTSTRRSLERFNTALRRIPRSR